MTRNEIDACFAPAALPAVNHSPLYAAALAASLGQDDEQDWGNPDCPECGGQGGLLGTLGTCCWFRCTCCGLDFNA